MKNILIVEDEIIIALDIKSNLEKLGYNVLKIASNYNDAVDIILKNNIDLVLLDIHLEKSKSGIEIAHYLRLNYHIPFVFLTAFNDEKTFGDAIQTAPYGYINKPFTYQSIRNGIAIAFSIVEKKSIPELSAICNLINGFPNPALLINSINKIETVSNSFSAFSGINADELINTEIESLIKEIDNEKIVITHNSKLFNDSFKYEKVPFLIEEKSYFVILIKTKERKTNHETIKYSNDIFIKNKSELHKLNINNILWIEAMDNYCKIITYEKTVIANGYLSEIEKKLNPNIFFRTHRSYIVNIDKIDKIIETGVLINDKTIPVSKSCRPLLISIIEVF